METKPRWSFNKNEFAPCKLGAEVCGCRHCFNKTHGWWFGTPPGHDPSPGCNYFKIASWANSHVGRSERFKREEERYQKEEKLREEAKRLEDESKASIGSVDGTAEWEREVRPDPSGGDFPFSDDLSTWGEEIPTEQLEEGDPVESVFGLDGETPPEVEAW